MSKQSELPVEVMDKIRNLKEGDHIAFGFDYNGGTRNPTSIQVAPISFRYDYKEGIQFTCHFLYGYKSLAETVLPEHIIGIGICPYGNKGTKIKGWGGGFDILQPDNPLLKK